MLVGFEVLQVLQLERVGGGDEVVEIPRLGCRVRLPECEDLCEAVTRPDGLEPDPVIGVHLKVRALLEK